MQIVHRIDDFLIALFPKFQNADKDLNVLKEELTRYYTYGPYTPKISIDGDWAIIEIDTPTILTQEADYNKVVSLCEGRKYNEAKRLLYPLIEKNPTNSEYHRILGQILSDEGDNEQAINSLIDSLKWNPKNGFALVMMGNIFAKHYNDVDTALTYYNQALKVNPQDYIAINNIGANLLQMGKTQQSVEYLEKAYEINPGYPNTAFGLSVAYDKMDFPLIAFDYAIKCMKITKGSEDIHRAAYTAAVRLANEYCKAGNGQKIFEQYKGYLEKKSSVKIKVEIDQTIPTAAKIEYAENYNRDYHLIKHKSNSFTEVHLMMHELVHLEFSLEAREENNSMLFTAGKEMKIKFLRDNELLLKKLSKEGHSEESIANFLDSLYEGINRQIFNTPIDLFIEDYLYENYQDLRPYQFLSLFQLINEGRSAVTDKKANKIIPGEILKASKILNVLNAMQFKDLYGIDMLKQFYTLPSEMKEAENMWTEFLEYRSSRQAGEEYEIIQHWGEDLKLNNYFELVDEDDYRNRPKTVEEVLDSVNQDPFGVEVDKNFKDREMKKFMESQASLGLNSAVIWYMVDALQFFKGMAKEKIKSIAFEIAVIGTQGINPNPENNYQVNSIPGKTFSGYHLLAFYYVSWKLAIPEMLTQLKLPFDDEFVKAEAIFKSKL